MSVYRSQDWDNGFKAGRDSVAPSFEGEREEEIADLIFDLMGDERWSKCQEAAAAIVKKYGRAEREGATPDEERWWGDVPSFDAVPVHLLVSKLDELQLVWPASASGADIKRHVAEAVAEWRAVAEAQPKALLSLNEKLAEENAAGADPMALERLAEGSQPAVGNDELLAWFDRHIEDESTHPFFAGSKSAERSENAAAAFRLVREILAEELADAASAVAGTAPFPVLYDELREAVALAIADADGSEFTPAYRDMAEAALRVVAAKRPKFKPAPRNTVQLPDPDTLLDSPAPIPKEDE